MAAALALVLASLGCAPQNDVPLTVPPFTVTANGRGFGVDMEANARMWRQIKAVGGDERWLATCHETIYEDEEALRPSDINDCVWQHYVQHVRPLIAGGAVQVGMVWMR